MTFRTKLLLISSFTVAGAVALVTGGVLFSARRSFERVDNERRQAFLRQLQTEYAARGNEIGRAVERAAASPAVQQLLAGTTDYDRAQAEAVAQSLDFLDVLQPDMTILSSAHYPARFGYQNDWQIAADDAKTAEAFLARVPTQEGVAIALIAVRPAAAGHAVIAGGRKITPEYLRALGQAPGMHSLLWVPPGDVIDGFGQTLDNARLSSLVTQAQGSSDAATGTIRWTASRSGDEAFLAQSLRRKSAVNGILLAGSSLAERITLEHEILEIGIAVAAVGILLGVMLGWWTTERITRPVAQLMSGARQVASGDWNARVQLSSRDEIGELGAAFNTMTGQLAEQRERAIQAERVAAWRELARRLAHELKNPLFPLQITIENMRRAKSLSPAEFQEVFEESTGTLLAEVSNLKTIIGRFSDFAKMPSPRFEAVNLNGTLRGVVKLYEAQLGDPKRPVIRHELNLTEEELTVQADADQLRRAFSNLVLNAIDAMPDGGTLRISTEAEDRFVRVSIADTGGGLTEEECSRLFTPYYTTKQHGTGLGLAIVQSVVSDHRGKISVASKPGEGTAFVIALPLSQGEAA